MALAVERDARVVATHALLIDRQLALVGAADLERRRWSVDRLPISGP